VRYAWIAKHKAHWPITLTCEVLGVSPSPHCHTTHAIGTMFLLNALRPAADYLANLLNLRRWKPNMPPVFPVLQALAMRKICILKISAW
jgi:hypothetical protein